MIMVDDCWILTCDHLWSLFGRSSIAYSTWAIDRLALHTRSCLWYKPTTLRQRQIVQKTFFTPHLEAPKDIATKTEENSRPEPCHHAKFHADRTENPRSLSPGKTYIFSLHVTPLGTTIRCATFLESSCQDDWNVMLQNTVFEIFAVKIWNSMGPCGTPKGTRPVQDPYLPPYKIVRQLVAPIPRYLFPDRGKKID